MNIHYGSTGMRSLMGRFFSDESGATATEYAMLIIFIALAIAGGATLLGNNINNLFSSIGASLSGLAP
jgi:pilus assembly protein Flp/PilA